MESKKNGSDEPRESISLPDKGEESLAIFLQK